MIEELEAHINGEVWDFGDDEWDPDEHDDDWLSIVPFGSHVTGLDSAASDLDLVVLDHFPPNGVRVHERRERLLPEIYNPYRLAKILRKARYRNVTVVASAAVQLVKFARRVAGRDLSVDVSDVMYGDLLTCADASPSSTSTTASVCTTAGCSEPTLTSTLTCGRWHTTSSDGRQIESSRTPRLRAGGPARCRPTRSICW